MFKIIGIMIFFAPMLYMVFCMVQFMYDKGLL